MAKRKLKCSHVWNRLGIDIMHVGSQLYLTIINCGPARFTIWRLLHQQDTANIIRQLESIFYNWGPPAEVLTVNGVAFSSEQFLQFLRKWNEQLLVLVCQCAARNNIVEKSQRSIKVIADRKQCSIPEVAYWYNAMPKNGVSPTIAPANMVHADHLLLWGIDIAMAPCNMQGKYRRPHTVSVQTSLEWAFYWDYQSTVSAGQWRASPC